MSSVGFKDSLEISMNFYIQRYFMQLVVLQSHQHPSPCLILYNFILSDRQDQLLINKSVLSLFTVTNGCYIISFCKIAIRQCLLCRNNIFVYMRYRFEDRLVLRLTDTPNELISFALKFRYCGHHFTITNIVFFTSATN